MNIVKELSGGISNKVYLVNGKALIRIFGNSSHLLVDTNKESYIMQELGRLEISPKILLEFNHGRLEEFIDNSRSLTRDDLKNDKVIINLINKIKQLHKTSLDLNKTPAILENIQKWTLLAKGIKPDFEELYSYEERIISMIKSISSIGISLCHNDLQKNNILVEKDTTDIRLIDFEYAGYNYIEFDIANFLCELSIDYDNNGFIVNTDDLLPFYKYICDLYMPNSDELIENLRIFIIAAHYLWSVWAIIKSTSNDSFDYMKYCMFRFNLLKSLIDK